MFSPKETVPLSFPPTPEPADVLEIRFRLSGDTLTKLISLILSLIKLISLSIVIGSSIWGYFQSQPPLSPTGAPAITTETTP